LGSDITEQLLSHHYNRVHIFSAFVTSSGTQRLGPALRAVIEAGGIVRALVGVANHLTSMQAVADLLDIGAEVTGLHTGGSILYHPKVYLLQGQDRAWISVGSSNLTGNGMYRNIETNTIIELRLDSAEDAQVGEQLLAWFNRFRAVYARNMVQITARSIAGFVEAGTLADELANARRAQTGTAPGAIRPRGDAPPPIAVPSLPIVTRLRPIRRRPLAGRAARNEVSIPAPSAQTRFFAMTLSAHDASKRTGMPGTPELSLPRSARNFFPPMSLSGRQFPDAYFDVRLNDGQQATTVQYRIWERPAGGGTGHADLRINIKHDTVDLTTPGGGDIILFEVTVGASDPAYDVWIVAPADPNYAALLQRCAHRVSAHGAGATKRYGFF
jgi:phospholipase D-like protein